MRHTMPNNERSNSSVLPVSNIIPNAGLWREFALVLVGSWLLALCAQVEIPMWPVPITGQTFGVLLLGGLLGGKRGAGAVAAYLAQASIGLPFFAGGAFGLAHLAGPTGGYLIGFVPAAFLVGYLCEKGWGKSLAMRSVAMTLGTGVIFAFGLSWLATYVPVDNLLQAGLIPFLPGAVIKIGLAALAVGGIGALARRWDGNSGR